jgi:hypothetical protein
MGPERELSLAEIERIRGYVWRTDRSRRIRDERGALRFIRELGFVLLMPIAGAELPSIHTATRDDWSWWDWKQTLPGRKACYYAKVLRNRGLFVSWSWFPVLQAAFGDGRGYQQLYREGLLDREERQILDLLEQHGPMMTRDLRLAFGPRSKQNTRRVKSILAGLQRRFLVTAAGGDTEGWSHHRWDLVERWVRADLRAAADCLPRAAARERMVANFVQNMFATTAGDIAWLFGWERAEVEAMVGELMAAGKVATAVVPELEGEVLVPKPWPGKRRGRRER